MLFDSHAHYDDEAFDSDRDEIIANAHGDGVEYILNASSDRASVSKSVALARKYPFIYAAIGIHPHNVGEIDESIVDYLIDLSNDPKVVAIGEVGLDYHYDFSPRELQKEWFAKQIALARRLKLPIIVHSREASEDTLKIIKDEAARDVGGVFHCYSGSVEMARELLELNFYIGVGGAVTFKNARKLPDVVRYIPEDRLLIETDCPYMTPEPYRGSRNDSRYVRLVAQKIAELRGESFDRVAEYTTKNARTLFKIGVK